MVVNQPIDMLKIQHKLRSEEYDEIDQLAADITLLVNNAKAYYQVSDGVNILRVVGCVMMISI